MRYGDDISFMAMCRELVFSGGQGRQLTSTDVLAGCIMIGMEA